VATVVPFETSRKGGGLGTIVVSQFVTVDGVMEDPGGSEGMERGGWALQFDRGEDGDRFKLEELMESSALLLGRKTYEGFAAAWPTREGDFADKFNTMPKFVVSSTLSDPEWSNSTVVGVDDLARLKEEQDGVILVNGSQRLMDALFERDLVDELRLMVFPTVLGNGKQLFGDTGATRTLELVESRPVGPEGVLVLVYRPK
jgi:dihydrofolate reductase